MQTFLGKIHGGRTRVIITSRSPEDWLDSELPVTRGSLEGLEQEEQWEYCEAVLNELNIRINRDDPNILELMKILEGHPLCIRIILTRLETCSAESLATDFHSSMSELGNSTNAVDAQLYSSLMFVKDSLCEDMQTMLIPLAFHERTVDFQLLAKMFQQMDEDWSEGKVRALLQTLACAGLVHELAEAPGIFQMHPVLTGFVRDMFFKNLSPEIHDPLKGIFVDVFARMANDSNDLKHQDQEILHRFHSINLRHAISEAGRLNMHIHRAAMLLFMAHFALNSRNFKEAEELFSDLGEAGRIMDRSEWESSSFHHLGIIA
ncbi:MAG: hypothetical protein GY852_09850, partial [bacterium]|nr:hypothetical protein [bacterium]